MYERKDRFYRKAKERGLRSRAAFKLDDLDHGLVRAGDRVVDLGCWPGGWLQVLSLRVGTSGKVVGVDLRKTDRSSLENVRVIQGDIFEPGIVDEVAAALGGPADVVLSDMAANATGHRKTDHLKIMALAETAALFAREVLKPGGAFLCKVLQGGTEGTLLADLKRDFATVKHVKPSASRSDSAELYVLATGFRGGR